MAAEEGLERTRLAEFGGSFDGRINKTKPKKRKEKKKPQRNLSSVVTNMDE